MKKVGSNFKKNFTTINQNEMICPKNSLKERIRELIKKNDETIKKYELLKTQSKNSQKKNGISKNNIKIQNKTNNFTQ